MKNLLLFMTDFYGYNENIISEINSQGYNVTWFLDKIELTQMDRLINKVNKGIIERKFDLYFQACLEKSKEIKFDKILIIFAANFFRKKHINLLRQYFPNVKIIYYAWDSVSNFPLIKDLLLEADYSFTFDPKDANSYNSKLLPLFYVNNSKKCEEINYDVSTVMSYHIEKASSLNLALSSLPIELKKKIYLKVRDKFYYYKMKIFNKKDIQNVEEFFNFSSLSRNEVTNIFQDSKAVIDCPLPNQRGLTMRTFEVLALNRKLITTNKNIKKYEFYTPDNIFIVESNQKIPMEFFNSEFNMEYCLTSKYSLNNFVSSLINVD